jgi:hypothetical protein
MHTVRFHPSFCFMQPWAIAALGAWALEQRDKGGSVRDAAERIIARSPTHAVASREACEVVVACHPDNDIPLSFATT